MQQRDVKALRICIKDDGALISDGNALIPGNITLVIKVENVL